MTQLLTNSRFARLAVLLVVLALPATILPGVATQASLLAPLAEGGRAYYPNGHALLLFLALPLVVLSASLLFLGPGLALSLALGRGTDFGTWVLSALGISLVLVSGVAGLATGLAGGPVLGRSFGLLCLALLAISLGALRVRMRASTLPWPLADAGSRVAAATALILPLLFFVAFEPKFLWESMNGDGAHAFESSRLLVRHAVPFWPASAGDVAQFPGVNSVLFTYPNGWYLRLFGEIDLAVRAPLILFLPVLFASVLAVAIRERSPARGVTASVWLALLAFALALGWSATYDPYTADIALPAVQDVLLMACFLGWVAAFVRRESGWLVLFTLFTYTASPSGLLLLGSGVLAAALAMRPVPWSWLLRAFGALVACLALGALLPALLPALGVPPPGREHGPLGILRYFAYLQITDWRRLLYVAVPAGFVPILVLFLWKRLDAVGRLITLVTAGYFLFFFVLAHVSLHHFVPAMILPVAVAARFLSGEDTRERRLLRVAWLGGSLAGLLLSLPTSLALRDERRRVAATINEQVGDYASSDPGVLRASTLLHALFPYDWEPAVPDQSYGGSPLAWNRYARHGLTTDSTNYVLLRTGVAPPAGMRLLASDSSAALYVRSDSVWISHRGLRPPTPAGSPVYAIHRAVLFHRAGEPKEGPRIIDTAALLLRLGIDVEPLLNRLGVRR